MDKKSQRSLFQYENEIRLNGFKLIAGIDEVGRGPLAGPVLAAAVILPEKINVDGINDSKKLSAKERLKLGAEIKKKAVNWSIGLATVKEIEYLNIHAASLLAMQRAVRNLSINPDFIMVDGRFQIPGLETKQSAIIKGDMLSASIAAASILAKVTRDRLMAILHNIYPEYEFDRHKGYATARHIEKLYTYGPCLLHRRSFEPVKTLNAGLNAVKTKLI